MSEETIERVDTSEFLPIVEALLFANGEPLAVSAIAKVIGLTEVEAEEIISDLRTNYNEDSSGLEIVEVAKKFQLRTKEGMASYIQELKANRPKKLSPAALETLAIIAYRQPVVKSEIEKIRGVDVSPTLSTLLERKLIRIAGQQATAGQPSLYATTDDFLKVFGLSSLGDLPNLREAQEIEESINQLAVMETEEVLDSEEEDGDSVEKATEQSTRSPAS